MIDAANNGPMLNAYPDSMGGTLADIVEFLGRAELKGGILFLLYSAKCIPYRFGPWIFCHRLRFK